MLELHIFRQQLDQCQENRCPGTGFAKFLVPQLFCVIISPATNWKGLAVKLAFWFSLFRTFQGLICSFKPTVEVEACAERLLQLLHHVQLTWKCAAPESSATGRSLIIFRESWQLDHKLKDHRKRMFSYVNSVCFCLIFTILHQSLFPCFRKD